MGGKLKAFLVDSDDWREVVYAETAGKAKWFVARQFGDEGLIFEDNVRWYLCKRCPSMDQFTTDEPSVEEDLGKFLQGGLPVLCHRCECLIEPGDSWGYSVPPAVLCGDCLKAWEERR